MDPTAFMPFFGNDFFTGVKGHSEKVGLAYLKAIWYYWSHTKCSGLKNDSEFLRKVCEVDRAEWADIYAVVFDNKEFFCMDADAMWHQKRAFEEWKTAKDNYDKAVESGKRGAIKRWGKR